MTGSNDFMRWCSDFVGADVARELRLETIFEMATCRIEDATRSGSSDPISAFSNTASDSAREASRLMLLHLGLNAAQVRVMRRLMAGSNGGWPGLIRLWLYGEQPTLEMRRYIKLQIRLYRTPSNPGLRPSAA